MLRSLPLKKQNRTLHCERVTSYTQVMSIPSGWSADHTKAFV
jgi:hypothetical protein